MGSSDVIYIDSSAFGALLMDEPTSDDLENWLAQVDGTLISSDLLETELRRIAVREDLNHLDVSKLMDGITLAAIDRAIYRNAGMLPIRNLRSLDAMHLEAAIRLQATHLLTYDNRMSEAAESLGLEVVSPGRV